jgi:hypothetical protein
MAHDALVELFKNRPLLAPEILAEVLGVLLPPFSVARLAATDLTEIQPAEYRADAVVVLFDGDTPIRVVVIEVQLAIDPRKRFSWPAYVVNARAAHSCPADLLIIAPDPAVAGWCAEPIPIGAPGFVLYPPVLGSSAVPVVTEAEEADLRPELGVLSAIAHGKTEQGVAIASAVVPAILKLDDDRAKLYIDLVYNSFGEAARRRVTEMIKGYEYQSDFAKKYVAEGRAEALLTVLRARGIVVPDAVRERIFAERDSKQLERWLEKATAAASVSEVFDEPS